MDLEQAESDIRNALGNPVFDYHPDGIPPILTDHLEQVLHDGLEAGIGIEEMHYDVLLDAKARQFRDDPEFRAQLKEYFEESGVTAQAITLHGEGEQGHFGWDALVDDIRRWHTYFDSADWISKATAADDLLDDGMSVVLAMQDTVGLETDVDRVDELYDFGVRSMQLTYNSRNLVGDGCTERTDAGFSDFGVDVVERLNELGIIVDLSHCGEQTTLDGIEFSDDPPAFTHIVCRDLHDHPRGKTDEELFALDEAGGYAGIVALPTFLGGSRDLDALVDHIDHAVGILDEERVWIASDWGMWTPEVPETLREGLKEYFFEEMGFTEDQLSVNEALGPMEEYRQWLEIPRALRRRGYSDSAIRGICGENFYDYFETIVG